MACVDTFSEPSPFPRERLGNRAAVTAWAVAGACLVGVIALLVLFGPSASASGGCGGA